MFDILRLCHIMKTGCNGMQAAFESFVLIPKTPTRSYLPPPENAKRDEVRFHRVFKKVHFAHLERISFRSSEYGHHFNKASSLIQYLQPSLKRFCLIGGSLSDEFFVSIRVNEDITDTTIEYIATRLPNLEEIQFNIQDSPLTEKSLISLGAHCKSLEGVYLSAEVSFEKLVQDTQPNHFPTLASVSLTQTDPEVGQCEDARTTVGLLLERAPALNGLDFASSDGTDWELQAAINELVNIRRAP